MATLFANSTPDGPVDEPLLQRLQSGYTNGEIVELAMCCAVLTGMAKLLFMFDLAEREEYCTFPHRDEDGSGFPSPGMERPEDL